MFAIRNFKFLGFALGKNGKGIYVRVHAKSWKKLKANLKNLSSRRNVQSIRPALDKLKVYVRGWLNYYGIADMKNPHRGTSTAGCIIEYACASGNNGRNRETKMRNLH
ncbi:MAG: hypothetical protein LKM41_11595 [Lachnospiraceae bacterium]|nr:hypothetical protein [Lachnospiraceae bacterium]